MSTKTFLYHRVPPLMWGKTLYPLNQLKDLNPKLYKHEVAKYTGRTELLKETIFPLHCLWNDVLHFTAVHPQDLKGALLEASLDIELNFFEVDPARLDPKLTTVYLYNKRKGEPKEYVPFDPHNLEQYATLSDRTKNYYKECIASKKDPLLFHMVPHILFKGSIDISKSKIIKV